MAPNIFFWNRKPNPNPNPNPKPNPNPNPNRKRLTPEVLKFANKKKYLVGLAWLGLAWATL